MICTRHKSVSRLIFVILMMLQMEPQRRRNAAATLQYSGRVGVEQPRDPYTRQEARTCCRRPRSAGRRRRGSAAAWCCTPARRRSDDVKTVFAQAGGNVHIKCPLRLWFQVIGLRLSDYLKHWPAVENLRENHVKQQTDHRNRRISIFAKKNLLEKKLVLQAFGAE